MSRIVTRADITLKIPPHFKNLTGKEPYVQEFKAGVPVEVPERIAVYYTKSWPGKFRYANDPVVEETENEDSKTFTEFNPVQFLIDNQGNYEQALKDLSRKDLNSVAKQLGLIGFYKQKTEQVVERIANDIKIQIEKEAKLQGQE
jgi:hypothetical protein